MKTTRRERQHAVIRDEIKTMARAHMARDGAAGLSLRAVAAEMGLSPAALYYYYPNRDALITELIVDAFRALGGAVLAAREQQANADLATQIFVTALAYRAWAVANPAEYALLFGTPIPGYQAPAEVTSPEARAALQPLGQLFVQAFQQGRLLVSLAEEPAPPTIAAHAGTWMQESGQDIPLEALIATLRAWAIVHGLVSLELDNQLQPIIGDTAALYAHETRALIRRLISC